MCKKNIFAEILAFVSQCTEIDPNIILSSSKEIDVVDARYILVQILFQKGFYPSQIAVFIGKSKRCVNLILTNFNKRMESGKMLGILWEQIRNRTGN